MQKRVVIQGRVQGVGFRYFVKEKANELQVTGWVRNTVNGAVEGLFQGEEEAISKLLNECRKGPMASKVNEIEEFEATEPKFYDFVIK